GPARYGYSPLGSSPMARFLARLGRFAAHRRWAVLAVWLAALIGLGGAALGFSGAMSSSFSIPGTQAQRAMDHLAEKMPAAGGASGRIVFSAPDGETLDNPEFSQAMTKLLADASDLPDVVGV